MKKISGYPSRIDLTALVVIVLLVGFGLVMVYSASLEVARDKFDSSTFFLGKQALRLVVAFLVFYAVLNVDYHWIAKKHRWLIGLSLALLVILLFSQSILAIKGSKRWISVMGVSVQPSDIARFALIVYVAKILADNGGIFDDLRGSWLPILFVPAAVCLLILLQPDFSTVMAILLIIAVMLFVGGLPYSHLAATLMAVGLVMAVSVLRAPYRFARIKAFLSPSDNPVSYQANQSLIGLGSGGMFGLGLGQSSQKHFFLPEPYTDFVFSIVGEELGFAGICVVFAAFSILIWRGYKIGINAPDRLGFFLATGISTMLAVYLFVHAGVVSSLLPTTGIPLPFMSYGGSNLIVTMVAMGVLLNISSQTKMQTLPRR